MPKFDANLSMMFQEVAFLDRFEAAAKAGFKGVEYLFPYDFEVNQLVELLQKNNLKQVLHNLPAGDWGAGERGIGVLADRIGEFQDAGVHEIMFGGIGSGDVERLKVYEEEIVSAFR